MEKEIKEKENMNIVIVGHVDHGKSTLIGRLLYDTNSLNPDKIKEIEEVSLELGRDVEWSFVLDNLMEEREQSITIDTTQINFKTEKRDYTIIDAPGHVEFLKNMITGASQAEAAVILIDINEGIREQTYRHAYILSLLGLKTPIVLVNKMDLVSYSEEKFNFVAREIEGIFNQLGIKARKIIPISAKLGENLKNKSANMSWYVDNTFLEELNSIDKIQNKITNSFRFSVQDVYFNNSKRIYVGRVELGSINVGEKILVMPKNTTTKIKSIEKFLASDSFAVCGECPGFTTEDPIFIERGDIFCKLDDANKPQSSNKIKVSMFHLSKNSIKVGDELLLRIATQEIKVKILEILRKMDSSTLNELDKSNGMVELNQVAEVLLESEKPTVFDDFNFCPELGRFVLEQDNIAVSAGIIRL